MINTKSILLFLLLFTAVQYAQTPQGMISASRADVWGAWGFGFYQDDKKINYSFGTTAMIVYFNSRDRVNKISTTTLYQTRYQLNSARQGTIGNLEDDGFWMSSGNSMTDGSRSVIIKTDKMKGVYRLMLTFK